MKPQKYILVLLTGILLGGCQGFDTRLTYTFPLTFGFEMDGRQVINTAPLTPVPATRGAP